jgi:hypothetical protein
MRAAPPARRFARKHLPIGLTARAKMVHIYRCAPKWGFFITVILRLHHDGADVLRKRSRSRRPACDDSRQMRVARRFAPPWRIHGTEAAYLVPIDSTPGISASA